MNSENVLSIAERTMSLLAGMKLGSFLNGKSFKDNSGRINELSIKTRIIISHICSNNSSANEQVNYLMELALFLHEINPIIKDKIVKDTIADILFKSLSAIYDQLNSEIEKSQRIKITDEGIFIPLPTEDNLRKFFKKAFSNKNNNIEDIIEEE